MTVIWTDRAEAALHSVENYLLQEFGENSREDFMQEAEHTANNLSTFPNLGKVEPLLKHRRKKYQSLRVTNKSKLIYYIDKERVVIADVWNTRREPKELVKGL